MRHFPKSHMSTFRRGFTLIELIIVIAIIAIVASAVFISIDPARRLHSARNATRWADVTAILEGVKKYQFDNDGEYPNIDDDPATVQIAGSNIGGCGSASCTAQTIASQNCELHSLSTDLRPYMKSLPSDPKTGTPRDSRYYVNKDEYGIVSVGSCDPEGEDSGGGGVPPVIEVTR